MAELFWLLRPPESGRKLATWNSVDMDLEGITCATIPVHRRAGKRLTDLSVVIPGLKVDGFVCTWYSECMIQESVLKMFRKEGFTGFEVKPVKVRFKRKTEIELPKLFEIVVTGWGGMGSAQSGLKLSYKCPTCNHMEFKGVKNFANIIDKNQWDGSDFFMVWPFPRFKFVTARVADFIRKNKMTGVKLQKPEDHTSISSVSDIGISPGRLSYYMPEKRAHELGDPWDIF